jgi:threonyl-tRNA synthetase
VVVAPVKDEFNEYAREVGARLRSARVRVEVDQRSERLDRKIRDAKLKKVPYIAVVGGREVEAMHVNVQNRAAEKVDMALGSFVEMITAEITERRR